jgi:CO/xanthine dehydrogenase Mo-binding subunit
VPFIETTGVGPYEGARVTIETDGRVSVATGVGTQGQGHFTSFAQIVADQLGVSPRDVRMTTGDTSEFHWGTGTFASRGAVVAANAINAAAKAVRLKVLKLGSKVLETPEEELELADGQVRVADLPHQSIGLGELAAMANPLRGAVEPGTEPGLEATDYFGPQYGATANGTHAMIVEVDPETMMIDIKKYVTVEDCGTVLNPLILEGQIHGGVSLGIANSYYEQLIYDENGQLLNASLADYLIPTATEVPPIEVGHEETPSPLNPIGSKGAGEAGTIPVPSVFAQALEDALQDFDLEILEMPLSPNRLFELLHGR